MRAAVQGSALEQTAAFFFVLTFVIKAFFDDAYAVGDVSAAVAYTKYVTAAIACLIALSCAFKRGERVFVKEFDKLIAIFFVFSLVSMVQMLVTSIISTAVFFELFKFVMPIILAYSVLNAIDQKTFYRCMVIILVVSIAGYIYTLNRNDVSLFEIFNADYSTSESATESSSFSGISLVLTFYFAFFRKRRIWLVLSAVFCILTFKRLAVIFAISALAISVFTPRLMSRRVSKRAITFFKILTITAAVLWTWILLPKQEKLFMSLFQNTPSAFTMGRSDSLRYLLSTEFKSYGFGSANESISKIFGMPFEMDLTKIALELTPIVMVLFVWLYWDVAGTTLWGVFIIGYFMLNMITSDSLTSNFCLTLAYVTCGLVEHEASKKNESIQLNTPEGGMRDE